jgi:SAM-dependent methyltransferase
VNTLKADEEKQQAIGQHTLQAGEFAERYRCLDVNPFQSCFAYSRRRLGDWLGRLLPEDGVGRRLLDIGCGTGHHLARMRSRGFDVAGVDGSREMLAHARIANPGVEVRQADVERLPFPDASFDFVLCVEVLRYLSDPSPCLREAARVLRPGGVLLATAAPLLSLNGYWLVNRLAPLLPFGRLVRLRQFFTTSARLQRQLRDVGFVQTELHGVYFGPLNWLERLVPWLLPRFLKGWERVDSALADSEALREFSNMFLVRAVRE